MSPSSFDIPRFRCVSPVRRVRAWIRSGATLVSLGVVLAGAIGTFAGSVATAPPAAAATWAPVHPGDFPDPSILNYGGTYYAFATQSFAALSQIVNIQVSTSSDGVHWTQSTLDALPQLPSWAQKGNTWAPTVAYNGSEFVMYYTATVASEGLQCIGVATSSTPLGPYTDTSAAPVVCQTGVGGSIDPDVFTSDSGQSYLLWKNDGNRIGVPTDIWSQPLTPNLSGLEGGASLLLQTDEAWQGGIIEGPDMVEPSNGNYYLFYVGNNYASSSYAIGWASCPSGPTAACTDGPTSSNPILTSAAGMTGPGGPDVFTLNTSGGPQLAMAFAAWQGNTVGYMSCGIRPMYLATLSFTDGTSGTPELGPAVSAAAAPSPSCPSPPGPPSGYWQVASDGGVFTFGGAQFYGSTGAMRLNQPVVGMAHTPDGQGYWLVARDGGVFAFGDAGFYGSTGNIRLNKPVIGIIPAIDGRGYLLIASDGGVFAFGDARFYGSTGGDNLAYPVTAAAPGFLGGGYWLVDANGQVFNFGDAPNEGQLSAAPGGWSITGMAPTHDDGGYWLSSLNGYVATFGDAPTLGSMWGRSLNGAIVGMAATRDAGGYWLQGSDGGIFSFGDAPFFGSMGGIHLNAPMVGIAAT